MNARPQLALLALTLIGLGLPVFSACRRSSSAEADTPAPEGTHAKLAAPTAAGEAEGDSLHDLIDNLSRLTKLSEATDRVHRLARTRGIDAVIDDLIDSPRFADVGAETMLFGALFNLTSEVQQNLIFLRHSEQRGSAGAKTVYYLDKPCATDDAVKVSPWWNSAEPIEVCPDAYRPEVRFDPIGQFNCGSKNHADSLKLAQGRPASGPFSAAEAGDAAAAEATSLEAKTACGCGPRLVFCAPDPGIITAIGVALREEVSSTLAHVIANDLPYRMLFQANETVRGPLADAMYARGAILAGEDVTMPALSNPRKAWSRRPQRFPGQHAGILSTLHILHMTDGVRDRMRDVFDLVWCSNPGSHGAQAEQILELGVTNLRDGDGWKDLAKRPFCTTCHARLDYGMQFFTAFPASYKGTADDLGLLQAGDGTLYGDDIDDPRGSAPLTPAGFAELVVSQPEFAACAVKRVAHHVFSRHVTPEDVAALEQSFAKDGTIKAMMKVALRRYADHWSAWGSKANAPAPAPTATPAPSLAPALASGELALPASAREAIDDHCISCHDGSQEANAPPLDLTRAAYSRRDLTKMLHHVAWRNMPKDERLGVVLHRALTTTFIELLWPPGTERASALAYYLGSNALPSHRASALVFALPDKGKITLHIEEGVDPALTQVTPGVVASVSTGALRACDGLSGPELAACVHRWTDPRLFVNDNLVGPLPPPGDATPPTTPP